MNYDYKYRLYPSESQETALDNTLDTCRQLYNHILSHLKTHTPVENKYKIQKKLPSLKSEWDDLNNIHSRVAQMVVHRLYNNLDSVTQDFEDDYNVERLRYKGEGWYKTFTYHQSGFDLNITETRLDSLYLSKIGHVPIQYHRELPKNADIKQVKIKREADGNWFAILGIETDESTPAPSNEEKVVTIGAGVQHFSIDSDGIASTEPDYNKLERERKHIKKNLDRKQERSNNFKQELQKLGEIDKKIDRKQRDYIHKLSNYYITNYDVIIVEDRYLGRRNSSWWEFLNMLEYKAESASTLLIQVDPDKSATKTCPECETESSEQYWLREHGCPTCGFTNTRDKNDLQRIHSSSSPDVGMGNTEVKPVDMIATVSDLESLAGGMAETGSSTP